jgi:hypothetical protein
MAETARAADDLGCRPRFEFTVRQLGMGRTWDRPGPSYSGQRRVADQHWHRRSHGPGLRPGRPSSPKRGRSRVPARRSRATPSAHTGQFRVLFVVAAWCVPSTAGRVPQSGRTRYPVIGKAANAQKIGRMTNPRSAIQTPICVREAKRSLLRMCSMCAATVRSVMTNRLAIRRLVSPCATSAATSCSR